MNKYVFLIIIIIIFAISYFTYIGYDNNLYVLEYMNGNCKSNILICINIYSDRYIFEQIESIKKYCIFDEINIIYNCSEDFNEKLLTTYNYNNFNIIINPQRINKERFTGLITKGIFSNFLNQKNNKYSKILILSERTIFDDYLNNSICSEVLNNHKYNCLNSKYNHLTNKLSIANDSNLACRVWHGWKNIINNSLNKSLNFREDKYLCSAHEGLLIDGNSFIKVNNFLHNLNDNILDNIYNSKWFIEEYIITNLCYNLNCKIASLLKKGDSKIYKLNVNPLFDNFKCIIKIQK